MMMNKPPPPPLFKLNNVDVVYLDIEEKELGLVIHVTCETPEEMRCPQTLKYATERKEWAKKYLVDEGIIPSVHNWKVRLAIAGHQPPPEDCNSF